jgi:hypothetical protein
MVAMGEGLVALPGNIAATRLIAFVFLPEKKIFLKGQCHEMVAEIRPWSGSLGLN